MLQVSNYLIAFISCILREGLSKEWFNTYMKMCCILLLISKVINFSILTEYLLLKLWRIFSKWITLKYLKSILKQLINIKIIKANIS